MTADVTYVTFVSSARRMDRRKECEMRKTTKRCECCGQTIKAPRAAKPMAMSADPLIDTAGLSPSEVMAYYKRRAPADDCAFVVRLFPDLAALVPPNPTKADAYRLFDAARHKLTPQPVHDDAAFWAHVRRQTPSWREGIPADSPRNRECYGCCAEITSTQVLQSIRAHGKPLCNNCIVDADRAAEQALAS